MFNKIRIPLILALGASLLSACAVKPDRVTCEQRDWYELGRRDGSQGLTADRLTQYQKDCQQGFPAAWESMYNNGRNAGLVEFCAPENAFELGRMGIAYMYVCPSTMESLFVSGYRRGQQARQIEIQNKELDARIDSLLQKIDRANNQFEKTKLNNELNTLKKNRARAERELASEANKN